jgi:hypothetical protein
MRVPAAYQRKVLRTAPMVSSATLDKPMDLEKEVAVAGKLDLSWLPFASKAYNLPGQIEDYVVTNHMICPSNLPNRNGIGFPTEELVKFGPPPMNRQVFKAWAGCPVHEEHDNEDPLKAKGVIFDTSFRRIQGFGDGNHWAVYGLIGVSKTKDPELAQKVMDRKINTGSMGCLADFFRCSVCGHESTDNPNLNCSHIHSTKSVNWKFVEYEGKTRLAYLNAYGLSPIEYSIVETPAWTTCLSDVILQS